MRYLSFSLWFTSLTMIISKYIHVVENGIFIFLGLSNISLYICIDTHTHHIFFIHSSVGGHLSFFTSWLLLLWILGCMNLFKLEFSSFLDICPETHDPRIAGSYGNSILRFLRNLSTILLSDYTNLHAHQQCKRIPFTP